MPLRGIIPSTSFARREVVAPAGLWERGAGASGIIPPSARLLPQGRASKAFATSPSGETSLSARQGAALDKHASNVSPPPLDVGPWQGSPAPKSGDTSYSPDRNSAKKRRHALRRAAGRVLGPDWRVKDCGQKALGDNVTLHHHDGHSHFSGIETCGSIWTCPVCAAKITEGRRQDLDALLRAHREAGGTAYMATFTIPHHRFQKCKDLRKAVSEAWRKVKSGKPWIRAREGHGWMGDVRALEITHGANGWHPHLHVLIFFKPGTPKETMFSFGGWLFDAWASAIGRLGMGNCSKSAFTFDVVNADDGAADYVGKWGAALELTKAHTKQGRNGGRTPWQILGDISGTQNSADERLFREYARAFKGARQLTWSREIRKLYLSAPEMADDELAECPDSPETQTGTLTKDLFRVIVSKGKTADVLAAQEAHGLDGVLQALTQLGIPWYLSQMPGLQRGRMVPLISLGPSQGSLRPDQ